ncbi:DinB family protein [Actinokineospora sp. NBRC 105648]|uniref:DinB family protein n=1 Tax=Actinokineospora sp. NBRC 105648 TaxID=3032206 RepID=UPI00249FA637|nr:DinB family protein [Actinokineospora sp. NBRC 105648]GLZ41148.1 hypothetical protein Acsp05_47720 [Actinokineospora sp. NBRC 105648]
MTDRPTPPLNADERTTLVGWLDFYRATLVLKCQGLTDEQLRTPAAPPSSLTLLGLVQHLTHVERTWFTGVLTEDQDPDGHDGGFEVAEDASWEIAHARWQAEVAVSRANAADRALDQTSPFMGAEVTLRWVYAHMIGEYARHNGHADLLRERLDGATGV